jgi:hypothetical protein
VQNVTPPKQQVIQNKTIYTLNEKGVKVDSISVSEKMKQIEQMKDIKQRITEKENVMQLLKKN